MTKQEFIQNVESFIRKYGYEPCHYTFPSGVEEFPRIRQEMGDYCRFTFDYIPIYDETDHRTGVKLHVQASVCKMGGDPSEDELWEAAAQINKGADFMHDINTAELSCLY